VFMAAGDERSPGQMVGLGHNRLSIIDTTPGGLQPMTSADGRLRIVFNGEIYNHPELRAELCDYPFRGRTDTEVILAAWRHWGAQALDRLVGMFAFLIWDRETGQLSAARDRFGVKPLYYHHRRDGTLLLASEIKALQSLGLGTTPAPRTWANYLANGSMESDGETFWEGIHAVPAGHRLTWERGRIEISKWYDLAAHTGPAEDSRPVAEVAAEYEALLRESVRLRFRSDLPVAINLSGGLDSSLLLALVDQEATAEAAIEAFTFTTGDPDYDELPWVEGMLARSGRRPIVCALSAAEAPELAQTVQAAADEPFGGLPTLAYARLFAEAQRRGVRVLLDGQGMDEQWGGYDYYRNAEGLPVIQGSREPATFAAGLLPEFRALAGNAALPDCYPDRLRNLQYRDITQTKLPRALRFNDRISMRASTELREPFLDHRLVELALRQPAERKIKTGDDGQGKILLREIAARLIPAGLAIAPKRTVQTPQREWLRGPLRGWATEMIEAALDFGSGHWFDGPAIRRRCQNFFDGEGDNSFFLWQMISAGMI
ncbi:MAG: asparagine synthase (glutamine-hydrolyzing), partial [Acidobacteriota bacterium]